MSMLTVILSFNELISKHFSAIADQVKSLETVDAEKRKTAVD